MRFEDFHHEGIQIKAGFDTNPELVDPSLEIPVYSIDKLPEFVRKHEIRVGIIAVPDNAASQVFDMMVDSGIQGVLNFAAVELKCSAAEKDCAANCTVHNVNIGLEIEQLFYQLNLAPENGNCGLFSTCSPLRFAGEPEGEQGPPVGGIPHGDSTLVLLHYGFTDSKTDTHTGGMFSRE